MAETTYRLGQLQQLVTSYNLTTAINVSAILNHSVDITVLENKTRAVLSQSLRNHTSSYASFQTHSKLILFQINKTNGVLVLPPSPSSVVASTAAGANIQSSGASGSPEAPNVTVYGYSGYTLQAGHSVTLRFNGEIREANDRLLVTPVYGQTYRVSVTALEVGAIYLNVTVPSP